MSDETPQPIAGWYPDPENASGDRWWNGVDWSDQRRARGAVAGWAPVAGGAPLAPGVAATAAPGIPVPPVAPAPADRPNPYAGSAATAYPSPPPYAPNYAPNTPIQNPVALGGMITSLSALLFNWFMFGLPGLVGGSISIGGLVKANGLARAGVSIGNGRGFAIAGIVTGFGGALLWNLFYFTVIQPISYSG